jgi:DNA-binding transcriptional ArsR family regulator
VVSEASVSEDVQLTDARVLRALAHPVRLAILEVLHAEGTATPTECSQQVGESPQACSYHLRALAKYGLVRRASSDDGRETRWELAAAGFRFSPTTSSAPEYEAAAQALAARVLERDDAIVHDYLAREHELEAEWREAALVTSGSIHVTSEELRELEGRLHALLAEYRRPARADRPDGARRVHVVARAVPHLSTPRRRNERA